MNSSWSGLMVDSQGMRNSQPKRPRPIPPTPGRLGASRSGPSPVDRARPGSKHQVLTDGQGIPLAVSLTGENRNDVTQLLPLPDKIAAVTGKHRGGRSHAAPCSGSRCDALASSVNLP